MVRVSYVNPPKSLEKRYNQITTPVRKTYRPRRRYVKRFYSRREKAKLVDRSWLPQAAEAWDNMTSGDRSKWYTAAATTTMRPYNFFVQETIARLSLGLPVPNEPSTLHNYLAGYVTIGGFGQPFEIEQKHPVDYLVMRRVDGSKSQKEPVEVHEELSLPLDLSCSFWTDLTAITNNPIIKLYARVISSYQGENITTNLDLPIHIERGWTRYHRALTTVLGTPRAYSLRIYFADVVGTIYFDKLRCEHSGTNFAIDSNADHIASGFENIDFTTRAPWSPSISNTSASFGSLYQPDEPLGYKYGKAKYGRLPQ